jgi:hypothetical protein
LFNDPRCMRGIGGKCYLVDPKCRSFPEILTYERE